MRTLRYEPTGAIVGGPLVRLTKLRKSSELVLILDGLRLIDGQPDRISAGHQGLTRANVMLADGHCESVDAAALAQSEADMQGSNGGANLSKRFPFPKWRMDQ